MMVKQSRQRPCYSLVKLASRTDWQTDQITDGCDAVLCCCSGSLLSGCWLVEVDAVSKAAGRTRQSNAALIPRLQAVIWTERPLRGEKRGGREKEKKSWKKKKKKKISV